MILNTYIHGAMPIRFVPTGYVPTDRYNTLPYELVWDKESLLNWQQKNEYGQKVQQNDMLNLQVWANGTSYGGATVTMELYPCGSSTAIKIDNFTLIIAPTDITFNGGIYNAYRFDSVDYWTGIEGRHYLYIKITSIDGLESETISYISEPIDVSLKHEGTVLVRYTHDKNEGGLIVEQTKQKFEKRITGALLNVQPLIESTSFIDSGFNTTELSANTFNGYNFIIGGESEGLPQYEITKMNDIFALKSKSIDQRAVVRADGAAWTKNEIDSMYPLFTAEIELRDANINSVNKQRKGTLTMMAVSTFPIVIMHARIGQDNIFDFIYDSPYYVSDLTALSTYATFLNTLTAAQGIDGSFFANSTGLYYTLAMGEAFDQTDLEQLTSYMTINHTTIGASQNLNFDINLVGIASGSTYALVNPGNSVESYGTPTNTSPAIYTSNYIPATAGVYTSKLFHDNKMYGIRFDGDYISSIAGNSPARLNTFSLFNSPRITSFPLYQTLAASEFFLEYIFIRNNITLSSLNGYYYSPIIGVNNSLRKVKGMDFRGNNMNTAQLNALYNNISGFTNSAVSSGLMTVYGGAINTSGQVTANTPNGSSSAARTTLNSVYGWTITI